MGSLALAPGEVAIQGVRVGQLRRYRRGSAPCPIRPEVPGLRQPGLEGLLRQLVVRNARDPEALGL